MRVEPSRGADASSAAAVVRPQCWWGQATSPSASRTKPEGTARLLDSIAGTVFTLGDNAYFTGSREDYRTCYGPTWGRHRARTRPVAGNHEYLSAGAFPYFEYFGEAAGPFGDGYYSFDIGPWHIIALNSNVDVGESSEQVRWLRDDLRASRARCTLADWHHPLFSSGPNGNIRAMQRSGGPSTRPTPTWCWQHTTTSTNGSPRRTPMAVPTRCAGFAASSSARGEPRCRQHFRSQPNSEMRISAFGVLKLTLSVDRLEWDFIPVERREPRLRHRTVPLT